MPNWVVNEIEMCGSNEEIMRVYKYVKGEKCEFDFNKIVPMPKSLDITESSINKEYVKRYLDSLNKRKRKQIEKLLSTKRVGSPGPNYCGKYSFCQTYWGKYFIQRLDNGQLIDISTRETRCDLDDIDGKTPEEYGKLLVDNINMYSADTWYDWCIENWGTKWNSEQSYVVPEERFAWFQTAWSFPEQVLRALSKQFPGVCFNVRFADEALGSNCGKVTFKNGEITDWYCPDDNSIEAFRLAGEVWGCDEEEIEEIIEEYSEKQPSLTNGGMWFDFI